MAKGSIPPRTTYHHGSLKEACIEQGMALLREVGLGKFSLREVARRVGVSPPALYHHFPDKNDLLAEIAEIGVAKFQATFETLVSTSESLGARLLTLANAYLDFFEERQFFMDIMFATEFEEYQKWREVRDRLFVLFGENLEQIGIPHADVPYVALWGWSAVHGMATLTKAGVFDRAEPKKGKDPALKALFYRKLPALRREALPVLVKMIENYAAWRTMR